MAKIIWDDYESEFIGCLYYSESKLCINKSVFSIPNRGIREHTSSLQMNKLHYMRSLQHFDCSYMISCFFVSCSLIIHVVYNYNFLHIL